MIFLAIGYDERESGAFHVLEQSVMDSTRAPVAFVPLHGPMLGDFDGQQDGTNRFIYSRFLVPAIMEFSGWAIYADSDMLARTDLAELWALRDESKAVLVCQHDYETRTFRKLLGTPMEAKNEHYPRKNWSSLILWNCAHPANRILTREFVAEAGGRRLHRFEWLSDDEVGALPLAWNWLVGELPQNHDAKLAHFTLGCPGFPMYRNTGFAPEWHAARDRAMRMDHF